MNEGSILSVYDTLCFLNGKEVLQLQDPLKEITYIAIKTGAEKFHIVKATIKQIREFRREPSLTIFSSPTWAEGEAYISHYDDEAITITKVHNTPLVLKY